MARTSFSLLIILIACVAGASSASTFDDDNPIRTVVSDALREFETSILSVVGDCRHALSFARFAHRDRDGRSSRATVRSENLKLIRSHNKKGLSYTLASIGQRESGVDGGRPDSLKVLGNVLTSSYRPLKDWRVSGIVSPVKDQGHCGSCWTFSTTGALEAAYKQAFGKGISLSEQQLVDCAGAFNNFGCSGGLPSQAFEYIKYNGGLDTEESIPLHWQKCERGISEVVNGFRLYKEGVYTSDTCGRTPMDVNHAVLAVGYGVENGVPYWLIKNSWGADWGDSGYFKMEMGKNMCGVATCASYPVVA
ncbi:aleurain-like protease [Actinidia rufa]|uniref:Aleurain-like protease n=1 Tax=Actinidia rufa TaxID=165716 RepID=A0A7J0E801_9ERIC|nr:aleurain-like protease [Actinidia rufa]